MAEDCACRRQYEFKNLSNLVFQADRTLINRISNDVAHSDQHGHALATAKIGDKHERTEPSQPEQTKKKRSRNETHVEEEEEHSKKMRLSTRAEKLCQPKARETCQSYEALLSFILNHVGFQPKEILAGAADEVLAVLKDTQINEKEKRRKITTLIGNVDDERFHVLINLVKKITNKKNALVTKERGMVDDESGVVFHGDDEDQSNKISIIKSNNEMRDMSRGDHGSVLQTDFSTSAAGARAMKEDLDPCLVDAYWLQKELKKSNDESVDEMKSQKEADAVLEILKYSTDYRDCENKLVLLLGYDRYPFIKVLLKNRLTVLYCTLLAHANGDDERKTIEEEMKKDPETYYILRKIPVFDSSVGDDYYSSQ